MIPTGSIPRQSSMPGGNWTLAIESMEVAHTGDGSKVPGAKMVKAAFVSVVPLPNMHHFENFVIGTESDPNALDPNTWITSFAATRMMQMLDAAKVQGIGEAMEDEELCRLAVGYRFDAIVAQTVDDGKRDPQYKGQVRSRITAFFEEGTLDTTQPLQTDPSAGKSTAGKKAPSAPTRTAPAAPATRPAPAARPVATRPAPAPAPAPVAAAPETGNGTEPEYVDENGNPCDAEGNPLTPPTPQPARVVRRAAPTAPATPAPAPRAVPRRTPAQ